MADGESYAPKISISQRDFIDALNVLTYNYFVLAVAGFGNYRQLHEDVDLSPACKIAQDGSIAISFDRANSSSHPTVQDFIETFFAAIKDVIKTEDSINAEQILTDKDNSFVHLTSLASFYNLVVALYNASEKLVDTEHSDVVLETDNVQQVDTGLSRIKPKLFPYDTMGARPS